MYTSEASYDEEVPFQIAQKDVLDTFYYKNKNNNQNCDQS
jgi:hypothetical protein